MSNRRYRDQILRHIAVSYAVAVVDNFTLMDVNYRPHHVNLVDDFIFEDGLVRIEWPGYFPDMNPIELLSGDRGRGIAGCLQVPHILQELKTALLEKWNRILQLLINSFTDSMPQRCSTLLAVQGNHTCLLKTFSFEETLFTFQTYTM